MYAGTSEITKCASYTSLDPVIVAYSTTETHPNISIYNFHIMLHCSYMMMVRQTY